MAQQLSKADTATAHHQCALSTRAGYERIAHALQGLTDLSAEDTVTSIDRTSAYDLILRGAMLQGLRRVD